MTDQHPITPPPELVEEWFADMRGLSEASRQVIATQAARWGADQELEACVEWMNYNCPNVGSHHLTPARRPKPQSLKEQALAELAGAVASGNITSRRWALIRRALEQLND